MTLNPATDAWESMLADANAAAPDIPRRGHVRANAKFVLRTAALLILAAVAILVLLPAALAAQATMAV